MIETEITLVVNRKSDVTDVKEGLISLNIRFPIYMVEYENHDEFSFTSDHEQYELESFLLNLFTGYEFVTCFNNEVPEIRLKLIRYQSELSSDGWGRRIDNPVNETKYLVPQSQNQMERFNRSVKVLFDKEEQSYFVNICHGENKHSGQKGFLLLDNFKQECTPEIADILKDKLYNTPWDAFYWGIQKMKTEVQKDFDMFLIEKKKTLRKEQRLPRKLIRDFIAACNCQNGGTITANLSQNMCYEKRIQHTTQFSTIGLEAFIAHLKSSDQMLLGFHFNIQRQWNFYGTTVTIALQYKAKDGKYDQSEFLKTCSMTFEISEKKISHIIHNFHY